jgi:hypothetical protein
MFNQQMHKVFVNTCLLLVTQHVSIPECHYQGAVHVLKLQTTECNRLLHVGVINEKIKTLKYCKTQQADALLNMLIKFSYLPPVKDALGLRTLGVYSMPCECRRVYIGQRGRSIQIQIKEQNRHIRLAQTDKSSVVEHSINHDHIIKL